MGVAGLLGAELPPRFQQRRPGAQVRRLPGPEERRRPVVPEDAVHAAAGRRPVAPRRDAPRLQRRLDVEPVGRDAPEDEVPVDVARPGRRVLVRVVVREVVGRPEARDGQRVPRPERVLHLGVRVAEARVELLVQRHVGHPERQVEEAPPGGEEPPPLARVEGPLAHPGEGDDRGPEGETVREGGAPRRHVDHRREGPSGRRRIAAGIDLDPGDRPGVEDARGGEEAAQVERLDEPLPVELDPDLPLLSPANVEHGAEVARRGPRELREEADRVVPEVRETLHLLARQDARLPGDRLAEGELARGDGHVGPGSGRHDLLAAGRRSPRGDEEHRRRRDPPGPPLAAPEHGSDRTNRRESAGGPATAAAPDRPAWDPRRQPTGPSRSAVSRQAAIETGEPGSGRPRCRSPPARASNVRPPGR